jgi:hypothetical protein
MFILDALIIIFLGFFAIGVGVWLLGVLMLAAVPIAIFGGAIAFVVFEIYLLCSPQPGQALILPAFLIVPCLWGATLNRWNRMDSQDVAPLLHQQRRSRIEAEVLTGLRASSCPGDSSIKVVLPQEMERGSG